MSLPQHIQQTNCNFIVGMTGLDPLPLMSGLPAAEAHNLSGHGGPNSLSWFLLLKLFDSLAVSAPLGDTTRTFKLLLFAR